jgi:hypothetical protein
MEVVVAERLHRSDSAELLCHSVLPRVEPPLRKSRLALRNDRRQTLCCNPTLKKGEM